MENKLSKIGDVVFFDYQGTGYACSYLNQQVIPKIKTAIDCYNALQVLPPFTPDIFRQWIETNGQSVYDDYMTIARKDAKKFSLPALQEVALKHGEEATKYFLSAWHDVVKSLPYHTTLHSIVFGFDVITFLDGQPIVCMDKLDTYFQLKIESEQQASFFNAAKKAEAALSELYTACNEGNLNMSQLFWTGEGGRAALFNYGSNGQLKFNPESVGWIK